MKDKKLEAILKNLKNDKVSIDEAISQINSFKLTESYKDIVHTKVDLSREERVGFPEVIYGENKSSRQIIEISKTLIENNNSVLITRVNKEKASKITKDFPKAVFNSNAGTVVIKCKEIEQNSEPIAVVTAGTSDMSVAEEASVSAEFFGNRVLRIYDVGVAGLQRLLNEIDKIRSARVVIVVAGMEGALASVIGGLIDKPIIAVPTSVGYGASFGGLTALLSMMNSCAPGVTVVNIDNGFGAGYFASMINRF